MITSAQVNQNVNHKTVLSRTISLMTQIITHKTDTAVSKPLTETKNSSTIPRQPAAQLAQSKTIPETFKKIN